MSTNGIPERLVVANEVPLLDDGSLPEGAVVAPFGAGYCTCICKVDIV